MPSMGSGHTPSLVADAPHTATGSAFVVGAGAESAGAARSSFTAWAGGATLASLGTVAQKQFVTKAEADEMGAEIAIWHRVQDVFEGD